MTDYAVARRNMVDCQVRPSDVTDLRVIDAMLEVPREAFVPPHLKAIAYLDLDLNVAAPGSQARVLIRPALLARMLQAADITPHDSVLVVGCASGYPAAVVARLAGEVAATETDATLAQAAKDSLAGLANVTISPTLPSGSRQYDVVIVNGASEVGFGSLHSLMKDRGRLVAIRAEGSSSRAIVVTRSGDDFGDRVLGDATAPLLPGFEKLPAFVF